MEHLWSQAAATRGNRPQRGQIRKRLKQADRQPVATTSTSCEWRATMAAERLRRFEPMTPRGASPCQAQIASETQLDERDVRARARKHRRSSSGQRRGSATGPESVELSPERVAPRSESRIHRSAAVGSRPSARAICPQRVPVGVATPQFEDCPPAPPWHLLDRHRGPSATGSGRLTPTLKQRESSRAALGSWFEVLSATPTIGPSHSNPRTSPGIAAVPRGSGAC